ncbi:MAG: SusC/RagA family TonB-linked outer membrane protein, partial [Bacteroidota bacterium]|nr:SusC/RagA family TonB-linked outer membrane protein [Bacteroidota bacterium]
MEKKLNELSPEMMRRVRKALLIVKLTAFLFLFGCIAVSASSFLQNNKTNRNAGVDSEQPQKKILTGKVSDKDGQPIQGASVLVKGTSNGAVTNIDGKFQLNIPAGAKTLVVSFVGLETKEVSLAGQSYFEIVLEEKKVGLNEVIITAFGIKREAKALGYAVQEVKGETLTEARETNVVNSLEGKVAGVEINRAGNGPGGSSRIVIRGVNSLGGNNQPLVVVDGIPISSFTGGADSEWGGIDRGSGLSDINPDDIESISVLKGPNAAALYGSRAGNGVLLITTKKGSARNGVGVKLNSNITFENPLILPKMQNEYAQGSGGVFDSDGVNSWGAKMTGQNVKDWTGKERPLKPYDNNITDFLKTGITTNNTVEMTAGSDKVTFWSAISYLNYEGAIPNNNMQRTTATFRSTAKLTPKLSADAKFTYSRQAMKNRPYLSGSPENIFMNYLLMPRSVHYGDMRQARDQNNNIRNWSDRSIYYVRNPYFTTDYDTNEDSRDRVMGFFSLQYQFNSWMNLKVRHGEDFYYDYNNDKQAQGVPYGFFGGSGDYNIATSNFRENNSDILLTLNKDKLFDSKFSGSLSLGGNRMDQRSDSYYESANGLVIPDFYAMSNAKNLNAGNSVSKKAIHSVYGFGQLSYSNFLYFDVTARNDWSSTLPPANRSYFYPSFNLGWVVSDMLKDFNTELPSCISFLKL